MAAIGVGLMWAGYWLGLSGLSMVKGWNNSPWSLANPIRVASFSTRCYTGSGIIPTGDPGDDGPCPGGSSSGSGPGKTQPIGSPTKPGKGGSCPPGYRLEGGICVSVLAPPGAK